MSVSFRIDTEALLDVAARRRRLGLLELQGGVL